MKNNPSSIFGMCRTFLPFVCRNPDCLRNSEFALLERDLYPDPVLQALHDQLLAPPLCPKCGQPLGPIL